jgi:uncharacterized membrane protein
MRLASLERVIARVLLTGVAVSAATLAAGLVLSALNVPWAGRVLDAGLILLMAIPIVRIIASSADAARRRDWTLVGATVFVLIVMGLTLAFSLRGASAG